MIALIIIPQGNIIYVFEHNLHRSNDCHLRSTMFTEDLKAWLCRSDMQPDQILSNLPHSPTLSIPPVMMSFQPDLASYRIFHFGTSVFQYVFGRRTTSPLTEMEGCEQGMVFGPPFSEAKRSRIVP